MALNCLDCITIINFYFQWISRNKFHVLLASFWSHKFHLHIITRFNANKIKLIAKQIVGFLRNLLFCGFYVVASKKIWFSFIIYGLYICELKRKIISRTEDGKNSHALWESDTFSGLLKVDETTITSSYPNQVEINSDLFTWENPFYRDVIDFTEPISQTISR